jgi:hypothetical protein
MRELVGMRFEGECWSNWEGDVEIDEEIMCSNMDTEMSHRCVWVTSSEWPPGPRVETPAPQEFSASEERPNLLRR